MNDVWKLLKSAPIAAKLGMAIVLLNMLAAVFAPLIAPYPETEVIGDVWENGIWDATAPEHDPLLFWGLTIWAVICLRALSMVPGTPSELPSPPHCCLSRWVYSADSSPPLCGAGSISC